MTPLDGDKMYGGGPTRQEDMYPPGGGHPPGMGDVYSTTNSGTPFGYPAQQPPYPAYGPPSGGGYPPSGGGYPPPPPQGGYGYGGGGYPAPQGGYPPPQGGYDGYPPPGGYPPNQGYPPQGGGYYGQPPSQGMQMQDTGPYRHGRSQSDPECNNEEYTGFTDPEVRKGFIKKVYAILSVQLAVTAAIVFPFSTSDKVQEFADSHHYLIYVAMAVYMCVMIPLVCCEGVRRTFPMNFILLGLMTIAMGVLAGFISSRYQTKIVLITLGMTALVCVTVTMIAWFAPVDITGCGLLMCVLGIAFTIFGIISMVLVAVFHLKIMILVYSGIAVALFSLYLMFDTQQIMGGKRVELSPEEYVLGALQLYIDIIQIFLNLLPLVAACFGSDD